LIIPLPLIQFRERLWFLAQSMFNMSLKMTYVYLMYIHYIRWLLLSKI